MKNNPTDAQSPIPSDSLPGANFQPTERLVISSPEQLKAISDPLRLSILELIAHEALTVKQMAVRLGQPPTRLYYHVAELEGAGFAVLVDTRVKSGIIEKYYRAASENITVDRRLLNISTVDESALPAIVSMVFEPTIQEIARSVATGQIDFSSTADHPADELVLARELIRLRAEDIPRFTQKFKALLAELEAADDHSGASSCAYACLVAFYPRPDFSGAVSE